MLKPLEKTKSKKKKTDFTGTEISSRILSRVVPSSIQHIFFYKRLLCSFRGISEGGIDLSAYFLMIYEEFKFNFSRFFRRPGAEGLRLLLNRQILNLCTHILELQTHRDIANFKK